LIGFGSFRQLKIGPEYNFPLRETVIIESKQDSSKSETKRHQTRNCLTCKSRDGACL